MKYTKLNLLIFSLFAIQIHAQKFVVSGVVLDSASKEPMIGANINELESNYGCVTNSMGYFALPLDSGNYRVQISFVGYKSQICSLKLNESQRLLIQLSREEFVLDSIVIKRFKKNHLSIEGGKMNIPIKQIQIIPSILGESDPLKIAQSLPGVQSGGEAVPGLFVRGSSSDQNLVLVDDAPLYGPFHLFGIFSVINSDALKTFEITKGGYSSEYGGRLASVVNMNLKEGDKTRWKADVSAGIGISKILIEAPIYKNSVSAILSVRRAYAHLMIKPFLSENQKSSYQFYDIHGKISFTPSKSTKIYLSFLHSGDNFTLNDNTSSYSPYNNAVEWENFLTSLRINKIINPNIFWNTSITYSQYNLKSSTDQIYINDKYYLQYSTGIQDLGLKNDFTYYLTNSNTLKFGTSSAFKAFVPDAIVSKNEVIDQLSRTVSSYNNWENAIYVEDEFKVGKKIKGRIGIRTNIFTYRNYTLIHPEPRVCLVYLLKSNWTLKSSYTQMHQYLHLITNKGIGLPLDLWIPATSNVPYKYANQFTFSIQKEIPKHQISVSIENYYKVIHNDISFKEGNSFMKSSAIEDINGNEINWEKNITSGKSTNFGSEFWLHKSAGRLQGWVSYSLSWSISQFKELNFGKPFYARHDRRHNFSVMVIYQLSEKIFLTANFTLMSGNPITVANSAFNYGELKPDNIPANIGYPWIA